LIGINRVDQCNRHRARRLNYFAFAPDRL
jgi:hypothetical protein